MLSIFFALVTVAAIAAAIQRAGTSNPERPETSAAWERAIAEQNDSQVGRILLQTARPLANHPSIYGAGESAAYKSLQAKLFAANRFASNVEVFLAVQALALLAAAGIIATTLIASPAINHNGVIFVGIGVALSLAYYPYSTINDAAKKRAAEIGDNLPDFAELLQMPLAAGMNILEALNFTAARVHGPVSDEVTNLLVLIRSRSTKEEDAFRHAAARLGTPEAASFFNSLAQAQIYGAKVRDQLAAQARALRKDAHQRSRAEIKQLPVKMVGIMAVFLLPLLFVVLLVIPLLGLGEL